MALMKYMVLQKLHFLSHNTPITTLFSKSKQNYYGFTQHNWTQF